jgi:filamentous hemagglutinin family protein
MSITLCDLFQGLGVAIASAIALSANCALAQIAPDTTLPNHSLVTTQDNIITIEGGTQAGRNLFHSFEQFSVPTGITAHFNNALDIQNIITRITGKSISNIDGILKANSTTNLFLINPNGIIFGPNASLSIGGSFVASTASSLNFADGTKFSATDPQSTPVLTVSVPIGLQFGTTANPIRNQSQASPNGAVNIFNRPVGLQVQPGKTLALVGGDLILEGGNITVASGRIELGSVASNSLVSLNPSDQGWALEYESAKSFQNIQFIPRTVNNSQIPSMVDGSSASGSSYIQVRGNTVELAGNFVRLITQARGVEDGGDLVITAKNLILQDGAQVITSSLGEGKAGNLTVNASESVDLSSVGSFTISNTVIYLASTLASTTFAGGKGGDIIINTSRLRLKDGAEISAGSTGEVIANQYIPATGNGGSIIINASESIELHGTSPDGSRLSNLSALTRGSGSAGNIKLSTGKLIVIDRAAVSVNSQARRNINYVGDQRNLGKAGQLDITARSIILDNKGKLTSETDLGNGGNITLHIQDLLLMRRNSQISTNAGTVEARGDGGNITIYVPNGFLVAAPNENSDITANAFSGSGGRVQIESAGIFNFQPRSREELLNLLLTDDPSQLNPQNLPTNDITAISQENPNLNGQVIINISDVDSSRGLVELPSNLVDASGQIRSDCNPNSNLAKNSFVVTGRGGINPNPIEPLISDGVLVDWINIESENLIQDRRNSVTQEQETKPHKHDFVNSSNEIIEAQGWVVDEKGEVILVADASGVNPHVPLSTSASCQALEK